MFKPISDRVLVKRDEAQKKTLGGLYLPTDAKEKPHSGTVLAVGEGRRAIETGELMPMTVKEGDKVLFSRFGGQEVTVKEETYLVLREEEIFCGNCTMTLDELIEFIYSQEEEIYILEPQLDFNQAIIGFEDQTGCLVYSVDLLVDVYCGLWKTERTDQTTEEAIDFMYYNISFGNKTPLLWENDCDMEVEIPENHFAITNHNEEIRVLPFLAKDGKNTKIE